MNFTAFDASYMERLQRGDEATVDHFVRYFSELIRLKLRSRLRSAQAIEDVRQETFLRVIALMRSENGIRRPERLGPLVNSVCNNVLFEQYRSDGRYDPLEDEIAATLIGRAPDALSSMISAETGDHVHAVLSTLKKRDRDLLHALFLQERDKDDICRELSVNRDYIRVLLHRAKNSYRNALRDRDHRTLGSVNVGLSQ
jgi:RNA polymerase sigma-70 factor (ECF subfamily)